MVVVIAAVLVSGEGTSDEGAIAVDEATGTINECVAPIDQGAAVTDEGPPIEDGAAPSDEGAAASDEQGTTEDHQAIQLLARRSIEILPAGQWPSLYDSYTCETQQRCPRAEFDQAGVDTAVQLGGDLRLLRFIRLESVTIEGSSAQAVITGEIAGQDEYQIQAAFQREASAWKIAPLPETQGCQAFLAS